MAKVRIVQPPIEEIPGTPRQNPNDTGGGGGGASSMEVTGTVKRNMEETNPDGYEGFEVESIFDPNTIKHDSSILSAFPSEEADGEIWKLFWKQAK